MTADELERLHSSPESRIAHNRAVLMYGTKGLPPAQDEPPSGLDELGRILHDLLESGNLGDEAREDLQRALKLLRDISLRRPGEPAPPPDDPPSEKGYQLSDLLARLRDGSRRIETIAKSRNLATVRRELEDIEAGRLLRALDDGLQRKSKGSRAREGIR
ncbi:MAG TPA: hypothetical protein VEO96_07325 [Thermoplasmata archaeon]|nr:hypothetical protein [Thermoplasmata archaeon]